MSLQKKLTLALLLSGLIGLGSFGVSQVGPAQEADVLIRALNMLTLLSLGVAAILLIFGAVYLATGRQRRREAASLAERPRADSGAGSAGLSYRADALDRRPVKPAKFGYNMGLLGVAVLFFVAFAGTGMDMSALGRLPADVANYGQLMSQGIFRVPDEELRGRWAESFEAMIDSVAIAWIGTLVGAVFSLPCGFLAARNMTTLSVYIPMRVILAGIRAVPEIVFAIAIMIPLFGVGDRGGAMAGAFALGISSIGTLSKLISEAIEAVDTGPVESTRAAGGSHIHTIRWAVLPQVMPDVIAIWLYRFEVNIRASAILGTLGAGGIGVLLSRVFDQRDWERIGIALVVIVLVTILVDQISAFIRHRVIHGPRVRVKKSRGTGGGPGSGSKTTLPSDGPPAGSSAGEQPRTVTV